MPIDYLQKILTAKVYDVAVETPLDEAVTLSRRIGNRVLLKREDEQAVFSFKLRGAYNKMAHLSAAERARGVIAASAGNHAQGVALAAQRLGCAATIVMPVTTPNIKIAAVEARGAKVLLHGDSYSDAYDEAQRMQKKSGATFVHPYDDPDVIAGQGTIGMEILRQCPGPLDAIFVAVGGGGLISGIAAYVKRVRPQVKVIGVQPVDSDAMTRSIAAGRRVRLPHVGLFADGVAVKQVGRETFRLARELVDEMITVDTDATCAAIKDVFEDTRSILEPAGALAIAGIKAWSEKHRAQGRTFVAIACGANMNFDRLRFVAERAELGEAREAIFAVTIPEERGSFRKFCALLGNRSVTEFNYRYADPSKGAPLRGHRSGGAQGQGGAPRAVARAPHRGLRPLRQRDGQASRAPPRGRARAERPARDALPLRISGAAGGAHALPGQHECRLEHHPLPLPQPWRRLWPGAGGNAGSAHGQGRFQTFSCASGLYLRGRNRQSGLSHVPRALKERRPRRPATAVNAARRHLAQAKIAAVLLLRLFCPGEPIPASFML